MEPFLGPLLIAAALPSHPISVSSRPTHGAHTGHEPWISVLSELCAGMSGLKEKNLAQATDWIILANILFEQQYLFD